MIPVVHIQVGLAKEGFATFITADSPQLLMHPFDVELEDIVGGETLVANCTNKLGSILLVHKPNVFLKV